MLTTDLTLKVDPKFKEIALRFQKNPDDFSGAFARAWFKLTHRDLGPRARYLGPDVPKQEFLWQDPIPAVDYVVIDPKDILNLKAKILASGLSTPELVKTAWASAATYRGTDQRGGANGARIRLAPEKDWPVNDPAELSKVLEKLTIIQKEFNATQEGRKKVSLADIIILSGNAAIERAAAERGSVIEIPFTPGRNDANQEQTDIASFSVLEPKDDGFRNFYAAQNNQPPTELLVNRANYLTLSVPETTVLVGGLRSLNANSGNASHGVFTQRPGTLSNDFFVNLLDPSISWSKSTKQEGIYEGRDRSSGAVKWTATPVDLIFGSNSELRAVAEVYASKDGNDKFVKDFVAAWTKVTNLDRFDIKK
jgi:catalase-peroxidase